MLDKPIVNTLSVLLGQRVRYIGRAGNMLWVGFGKDVVFEDYKGNRRTKAKYALHISGAFRVQDDSILFGSYDMYIPNSNTEWTEEFDCGAIGTTYFDECATLLTKEFEKYNIIVVCINASHYGDLHITLSNRLIINAFINNGSDSECWRFFSYDDNEEHFIVTGRGIETVKRLSKEERCMILKKKSQN